VTERPRYDGHADWYDDTFSPFAAGDEAELLSELIGRNPGEVCLEIACGTGRHVELLVRCGYRVLGLDVSADQLRIAQRRVRTLVRGDALGLPIREGSIRHALGMYFHTDIEDFAAALREVARCLSPSGRFVYLGLHPCYIGPFVDRSRESEEFALRFERGYGDVGWSERGSGGGIGLWSRVGGHHKTLTAFLNAFIDARLTITRFVEFPGGGTILPRNIGLAATKLIATEAPAA